MRRESRFTRSFPLPAAGSDLRRVYLGLETQPEESKRETQEESDSCPGSGCSLCRPLPVHRAKLWGRYPNSRTAARSQHPFCGVPTQLVGRASLRQKARSHRRPDFSRVLCHRAPASQLRAVPQTLPFIPFSAFPTYCMSLRFVERRANWSRRCAFFPFQQHIIPPAAGGKEAGGRASKRSSLSHFLPIKIKRWRHSELDSLRSLPPSPNGGTAPFARPLVSTWGGCVTPSHPHGMSRAL